MRNQSRWDADRLVFLDETGMNRGMTPAFAWAPRGERADSKVPHDPGKNVSIIGVYGLRGLVAADWKHGGFNGDDFERFVRELVLPKLQPGDTLVLDNASIHKRKSLKNILRAAGVRLRFLPQYSPELDPIENVWSKVKSIVRRLEPRSVKALVRAVKAGFDAVVNSDLVGWFKHAGYRVTSA